MTALTSEEYGQRKLDLVRAIDLAEGEVHSIAFKVSTGAADEARLSQAKSHLAALREKLADLESAWVGAQDAARQEREAEVLSSFDGFMSEVDAALAVRHKAIERILKAMQEVAAAAAEYDEATASIRLKGAQFFRGGARHKADSFLATIRPDVTMPVMAISAALADAEIRASGTGVGDRIMQQFREGTVLDAEDRLAAVLRERCEALAPEFEAAA